VATAEVSVANHNPTSDRSKWSDSVLRILAARKTAGPNMIIPECQGSGLGAALQQRLKEFAVNRGVRGFVAEVLQTNLAMLNLAKRLGNIRITTENGTYQVTLLFA
jgi:L-amino acid N-acyltransferase YncA